MPMFAGGSFDLIGALRVYGISVKCYTDAHHSIPICLARGGALALTRQAQFSKMSKFIYAGDERVLLASLDQFDR